jgi:hypothetical protein
MNDAAPDLDPSLPEETAIPRLLGQVYEAAPVSERSRLVEQLVRPLGLLSLVAIAGGVFAGIRLRGGWPDFHVRIEDLPNVRASDVMALAEHAQQVSVEAVDGLAQVLAGSPVLAGSAATVLLVTLLMQRSRRRTARSEAPAP